MEPLNSSRLTRSTVGWRTSPVLGLAAAIAGVLLAIALLPQDVEPAGALSLPTLVLSVCLLTVPLLLVWSAPATLFHPVHVVAASPVYWLLLDTMQGAYDLKGIGRPATESAIVTIGLFSSGVWIAALQRPWRLPGSVNSAARIQLGGRQLYFIAVLAFLFSFLRFAIPARFDLGAMLGALSQNRWAAPWSRGALGGWDAFLDHLAYFGYVLPALTVLLSRQVGWRNWRTVTCAGFAAVILALSATGGGRRIVGVMVGNALLVWFLAARPPRLRHVLVVAVLCVGLLFVMQQMLLHRNAGFDRMLFTETQSEGIRHLHVDDNFLRLCQIIQIIPEHHPHVTWKWLLWVAVRPVPRVFWPGKPLDPGFDLASYNGMQGVSLSCSLVGEAYMAFGMMGVFVCGWVLGRLASSLALVLESHEGPGALIVFGSGVMALFAGMRSGLDLVLMSYVVLAWIALVVFYKQFYSSAPPERSQRLPEHVRI